MIMFRRATQQAIQSELAKHQLDLELAQRQAAYQQGLILSSTSKGSFVQVPTPMQGPGSIMPISTSAWPLLTTLAAHPYAAAHPYYIELPDRPLAGDKITVYFDGTKWLEDRDFVGRKGQQPLHGGFSLSELEEAKKIMDDCSAA
jgi:hypothetical protein